MPTQLCCSAASRSSSPDLPNVRVIASPRPHSCLPDTTQRSRDSRFATTRTEDLQDIQRIFANAETDDKDGSNLGDLGPSKVAESTGYQANTSPANLKDRVRKRLSKDASKSKASLRHKNDGTKADREHRLTGSGLRSAKQDLRRNLLSDRKADEGGYDSDAEMIALQDVDGYLSSREGGASVRGRKGQPRSKSKSINWPGGLTQNQSDTKSAIGDRHGAAVPGNSTLCLSTTNIRSRSTSPANKRRDSVDAQRLRKSLSDSSLHTPATPISSLMRLPSMSASLKSSSWKLATIESLRLTSSPLDVLATGAPTKQPHGQRAANLLDIMNWPSVDPRPQPMVIPGEDKEVVPVNVPSSEDQCLLEDSAGAHVQYEEADKEDPAEHTENAGEKTVNTPDPNVVQEKGHSPTPSVHLYTMRISHHLRSPSALSAASTDTPKGRHHAHARSSLGAVSPVPLHPARHKRQVSSSGFASGEVPANWGHVMKDESSSMYSACQRSDGITPADSMVDLPSPGGQDVPAPYTIPLDYGGNNLQVYKNRPKLQRSSASSENPPIDEPGKIIKDESESEHSVNEHEVLPHPPPGTACDDITNLSQLRVSNRSCSSNLSKTSKTSKFKEEFDATPKKQRSSLRLSLNFFRHKHEKHPKDESIISFDGPSDTATSPLPKISMGKDCDAAANMWEKALRAHQQEKSALFLAPNKAQVKERPYAPRERSHSFSRPRMTSITSVTDDAAEGTPRRSVSYTDVERSLASPGPDPFEAHRMRAYSMSGLRLQHSPTYLEPPAPHEAFLSPSPRVSPSPSPTQDPPPEPQPRHSKSAHSLSHPKVTPDTHPRPDMNKRTSTGSTSSLGAWSRYPSHTRAARAGSAGRADNVIARDFALEIHPEEVTGSESEEASSPSNTLNRNKNKKKKKKRAGTGGKAGGKVGGKVGKTRSLVFAKNLLGSYARLFRSQSMDFHRYGKGHRSSVSVGGVLEYPELEILPPMLPVYEPGGGARAAEEVELAELTSSTATKHEDASKGASTSSMSLDKPEVTVSQFDGLANMDDSINFDASPTLANDPNASNNPTASPTRSANPRMWSKLYESCVELPATSEDLGTVFGTLAGSGPEMTSKSLPTRFKPHERSSSALSGGSLRSSTVDLCRLVQETEARERERLLGGIGAGEAVGV